jgi:hypothetical protein
MAATVPDSATLLPGYNPSMHRDTDVARRKAAGLSPGTPSPIATTAPDSAALHPGYNPVT